MSDQEWLEQLFKSELPEMTEEEVKHDAKEITESIKTFDKNLDSCNKAAVSGTSKEHWLTDKLQEASVGMSVNEYGKTLQQIDDVLYAKKCRDSRGSFQKFGRAYHDEPEPGWQYCRKYDC